VFRGRDDKELEVDARGRGFGKVRWVKPLASRAESREAFLLATDFNPPSR
jgi:23S rRNA U2552 (ribose-2'-O)-methylase RlmE/FtsJ